MSEPDRPIVQCTRCLWVGPQPSVFPQSHSCPRCGTEYGRYKDAVDRGWWAKLHWNKFHQCLVGRCDFLAK